MDASDKFVHEKVFEIVERYGARAVCDYGCGEGTLLSRLQAEERVKGRLVGIDVFSKCFPERKVIEQQGLEYVDRDAEDFTRMLGHDRFDLVISSFALHHFRTPVKELRNLWRLVAPGAHVLLIDMEFGSNSQGESAKNLHSLISEAYAALKGGYHRHHYTLEEALDLVSSVPFNVVEAKTIKLALDEEEKARVSAHTREHIAKAAGQVSLAHPFLNDFFEKTLRQLVSSTEASNMDYSSVFYMLLSREMGNSK